MSGSFNFLYNEDLFIQFINESMLALRSSYLIVSPRKETYTNLEPGESISGLLFGKEFMFLSRISPVHNVFHSC